jgi:hypothetical protein
MPVFDDAQAYFITWTTYGTWLPGDPRGHVSNPVGTDDRYHRKSNRFGSENSPGDQTTLNRARAQQKWETVWLNSIQAGVCAEAMLSAAKERSWRILRSAVMCNDVHVVLVGSTLTGPLTSRALKGVSQARLSDAVGRSQRWWTRRGSERSLSGSHAILATMKYIENQEGILIRIAHNQIVPAWPTITDP